MYSNEKNNTAAQLLYALTTNELCHKKTDKCYSVTLILHDLTFTFSAISGTAVKWARLKMTDHSV